MEPTVILDFWFRELEPRHWFEGGEPLDETMTGRFSAWVEAAMCGDLDAWASTPRGRLALILLLDQFTRNIHRGTPAAFAGDARAQTLVVEGLELGADKPLNLAERHFFYMPLMHAENASLQAIAEARFADLVKESQAIAKYQADHAAIIDRFGRFPTRNAALERTSTTEEQAFLDGLRRKTAKRKPPKPT